jgi:hypothetical protein
MIDFTGTFLFSESSSNTGTLDSYQLSLVVTNFFHYSGKLNLRSKPVESIATTEGEMQEWKVSGQRNMGGIMEIHVIGKGKYQISKTEDGINWAFTGSHEDWNR